MHSLDTAQLAKKTGVTSRTLRHYDAIGLLTPAQTSPDGRRYYGEPELLRLQHILVLRELGVDLATAARVLESAPENTVAILRDHLGALTKERDRFGRLATTVSRTIDAIERNHPMSTEEMFEGFAHARYEPEARERWGDDAVDSSNANWDQLGEVGKKAHMRMHEEIVEALGAAVRVKFAPDSDEVQQIAARHYEWIKVFWVPTAEQYRGLTQMYVDDERFRMNYDEVAPGSAALLRDAASIYSTRHLA